MSEQSLKVVIRCKGKHKFLNDQTFQAKFRIFKMNASNKTMDADMQNKLYKVMWQFILSGDMTEECSSSNSCLFCGTYVIPASIASS